MASIASRVKETTTTTGTGTLTLAGAVAGFQIFLNSRITSGDYVPYTLLDANGTGWETGYGVATSGSLTREFVLESSNAGAAITLTAGTHTVFLGPNIPSNEFRGLKFRAGAGVTVADATPTRIDWGTVELDTDNMRDAGNPDFLYPPDWASLVRLKCQIYFQGGEAVGTNSRWVEITNGGSTLGEIDARGDWIQVFTRTFDVSTYGPPYFVDVYQNEGATETIHASHSWIELEIIQ